MDQKVDATTRLLNVIFLADHERSPSGWVVRVVDLDLETDEVVGPFSHPRDAEAWRQQLLAVVGHIEATVLPLYPPE